MEAVTSSRHQDNFEPALQNLAKENGHHKVTSDLVKETAQTKHACAFLQHCAAGPTETEKLATSTSCPGSQQKLAVAALSSHEPQLFKSTPVQVSSSHWRTTRKRLKQAQHVSLLVGTHCSLNLSGVMSVGG